MTISARGKSFQSSIVLGGKRYRRSFRTYADAEAWELECQLKHKRGEPISTKKEEKVREEVKTITWSKLSQMVYDQRWKHQKSPKTHLNNSKDVAKILGDNKRVSDVTQKDIDNIALVIQKENPDVSVSTINRKYSALSVLMRFALKRGYIDKLFEIPKYKEPEHRIRWISDEEEEHILEYFKQHKPIMVDIVTILIDTGLRCSELWRLKVGDVSDTHVTVWVSKGGKARSVPLTRRARKSLLKYTEGRKKEEVVFTDWTNWMLTHYWGKVRDDLGLTEDAQFVPHILRHTFCSRLVQRSVPLPHVQKLAGHSSVTTTMRYAHLSQTDLDQAILALEQ